MKPTHLPSPFFDHFCPIPIDRCYVLADDSGLVPHFTANSFPTPSFPVTSERVQFHFVSFCSGELSLPNPRPPNPKHHKPEFFWIPIPEPDHPVFKPTQFQKSDPVLVQFLLTRTGTGGSICPTGVKQSNHGCNCTQVLVYPNNHNFL